jgi:hypothetical protein
MDLTGIGGEDMTWIHLAQDRVQQRTVVKTNERLYSKKGGEFHK